MCFYIQDLIDLSTLWGGQTPSLLNIRILLGTMLGLCWRFFAHLGALGRFLGASWALLPLLAAFVVALGWFLCVLDRSGLDLGGFGKLQNLIF